MKRFSSLKKDYVSYGSVLLLGLLMSALAASASTTISTNVNTGGTLTVTGVSTLTGAINASSTLATSGNITVVAGYGLDTAGGGVLNLGTTTATTVIIGSSSANVGVASSSPYVALGVTGTTTASAGMVIGATGTALNRVVAGSCALIIPSGAGATVAASSTAPFDCAVTGVTSGDNVIVELATTTAGAGKMGGTGTTAGLFIFAGAKASSTAGYITVLLLNMSGAATQPSLYGYGSSTAYWIFR